MTRFFEAISTGFYIGKLRGGGTIATLCFSFLILIPNKFIIFLIIFILSIISSYIMLKKTNSNDPPEVVIDEVLSFIFLFLFIEVNLRNFVIGFVLIRIFDFLKPFPSNLFENVPYLGIVLDDLMASIYTLVFIKFVLV